MIFRNDLSPYAVHLHAWGREFGVRWYGLAYAAGLALAYVAFRDAIRDGRLRPKSGRALERLSFAAIVGVVGGGRAGFVLQDPSRLLGDPLSALRLWEGGMAFFGGLAGVVLGLRWVARKEGIAFLALTDVAAPAAMIGLGLGRLANFANAELWGRPTGAGWGVVYPNVDLLPRHPSELYEAASHFLAFGILALWAVRKPGRTRAGLVSAMFLVLYGTLRFLTDFYREEPLLGPLNAGQWASAAVAAAGAILLAFRTRDARKTAGSPGEPA